MATVKKIKKAQTGWMGKKAPKDSVYTETGRLISKKEDDAWRKGQNEAMNDEYFNRPVNKKYNKSDEDKKKAAAAVPKKKMKAGGSFPDLNKDGKITKADVLVGRGVIKAKKGAAMKKASKAPKKMMKMGGKCKYGC